MTHIATIIGDLQHSSFADFALNRKTRNNFVPEGGKPDKACVRAWIVSGKLKITN